MEITKLLKRLEDEGQKVLNYLTQLTDETWTAEIYTESEVWTVHQILAHFVSVERTFQWLTADIVRGGKGAPEDFDLDRFNNEQVLGLQSQSRHELQSSFKSERAATIKQTSQYDSDDLAKEGNHPWFGQVSVSTLLKLLYRHNQLHLRDIRRRLSAQSA
jgi:uncharacterized damage-inducible protein DinB